MDDTVDRGRRPPVELDFDALQREAESAGRRCVVGAVVTNPTGQAYLQLRAAHVRHFPGCWDIIGGHVEPGETLPAALAREIEEETGWRLENIVALVRVFDWDGSDGEGKREIDVLATVDGDLSQPSLERDNFTEGRWFDATALADLAASTDGDTGMIELARQALLITSVPYNRDPYVHSYGQRHSEGA